MIPLYSRTLSSSLSVSTESESDDRNDDAKVRNEDGAPDGNAVEGAAAATTLAGGGAAENEGGNECLFEIGTK